MLPDEPEADDDQGQPADGPNPDAPVITGVLQKQGASEVEGRVQARGLPHAAGSAVRRQGGGAGRGRREERGCGTEKEEEEIARSQEDEEEGEGRGGSDGGEEVGGAGGRGI